MYCPPVRGGMRPSAPASKTGSDPTGPGANGTKPKTDPKPRESPMVLALSIAAFRFNGISNHKEGYEINENI